LGLAATALDTCTLTLHHMLIGHISAKDDIIFLVRL